MNKQPRSSRVVEAEKQLVKNWQGLSKRRPLSSFNQRALEQGAKTEFEHVGYMPLARRIAADHLTEDPAYYRKLKRAGLAESSAAEPLVFYHGAQRWEGPPEIRPSKTKKVAVHGPGLYLTSNRRTAERYAKGGGIVLRMEVSPDLHLLSDAVIPVADMLDFVKNVPRMRKKKEIASDIVRYADRVKRDVIPANVLLNLMNHYEVGYGDPGAELVRFYVDHGIDGDVVERVFFSGMEEDEKWLVLFNTDKILKHERSMPEARPRRSTRSTR